MRQTILTLLIVATSGLLSAFTTGTAKEEYGKAGYYADSLQGRKTASGEAYNKNDLTCAHKSLPFGTMVRITRIDNKKSVVVRVNDRGPYIDGYVVDVSRKAAEQIGLIKDGVTRVKLEVVQASPKARVAAETDGNTSLLTGREQPKQLTAKGVTANKIARPVAYSTETGKAASRAAQSSDLYKVDLHNTAKQGFGVQISSLSDADNVLPVLEKVQSEWPGKTLVLVSSDKVNNLSNYKLIIGPFSTKSAAESQQKLAVKKGYKRCFVVDLATL